MKKIYLSVTVIFFGLFFNPSASKATAYFLQAGQPITTLGSWGTNTDGSGTAPTVFNGSADVWNLHNNATLSLNAVWGIASNAIVNFGDGTSPLVFSLDPGGRIGSSVSPALAPRVNFNDQCRMVLTTTVNFNTNVTKTAFNTGSIIEFAAGAPAVPKFNDAYENVVVSSAGSIGASNIVVNGDLTVAATFDLAGFANIQVGNLVLNNDLTFSGGQLTITGTISGVGLFAGDNAGSSLTLLGTGNVGTLNFSSGFEYLSEFVLALGDAASSVSLGGDLYIDGGSAILVTGGLDLNTFQLNIMSTGAIDFSGGGTIMGDPQASLWFDGIINGPLLMDATDNLLAYVLLNSNGNTLTIGNTLNIIDSISAHDGTLDANGNLVIISTLSLKGRLGLVQKSGGTASVTGDMTVVNMLPDGNTGWANIGVSGVTGNTVADWDTWATNGHTSGIPMQCEGCNYGSTSTGYYFESIQGWVEATDSYDTLITAGTTLVPGVGYWVYVGDGAAITNTLVLINKGPAVTGPVNLPCTKLGTSFSGFNLVANPYASPISWDKTFLNNSNNNSKFAGAIYAFSADLGQSTYVAGTPGTGTGAFDNSGQVAMGQAFYVRALSNAVNLEMEESVKIGSTNVGVLKPANSTTNTARMCRLRLKGAAIDNKDDAVIRILNDATMVWDDKYDAVKIFQSPGYAGYPGSYSQYTSISSKDPVGDDYAINSIPAPSQSLTIPVLVRVISSGQYTITASEYENLENCLFLKDKLTGLVHDLKSGPLVVTVSDTTSVPRFELTMCAESNPVGLSEVRTAQPVFINQDQDGAFVSTDFEKPTRATISAYNIMGQQVMDDMMVEGTSNLTRLNLNMHNQVVLIRVTTDQQTTVKKIIAH